MVVVVVETVDLLLELLMKFGPVWVLSENPAVGIFGLACFYFFFLDFLLKSVSAPNTLSANNMDVTEW